MIVSSSFSKFLGHIVFEKQGFPSNLVERRRCHKLLQPIDPVDVCVSFNGGPNGNKCLVGLAAEKEELDIIELAKCILFALFVEEP
jgi:hypothetical protein